MFVFRLCGDSRLSVSRGPQEGPIRESSRPLGLWWVSTSCFYRFFFLYVSSTHVQFVYFLLRVHVQGVVFTFSVFTFFIFSLWGHFCLFYLSHSFLLPLFFFLAFMVFLSVCGFFFIFYCILFLSGVFIKFFMVFCLRCDSLHPIGRLSSILGWRSASSVPADQSWRLWCRSHDITTVHLYFIGSLTIVGGALTPLLLQLF